MVNTDDGIILIAESEAVLEGDRETHTEEWWTYKEKERWSQQQILMLMKGEREGLAPLGVRIHTNIRWPWGDKS